MNVIRRVSRLAKDDIIRIDERIWVVDGMTVTVDDHITLKVKRSIGDTYVVELYEDDMVTIET